MRFGEAQRLIRHGGIGTIFYCLPVFLVGTTISAAASCCQAAVEPDSAAMDSEPQSPDAASQANGASLADASDHPSLVKDDEPDATSGSMDQLPEKQGPDSRDHKDDTNSHDSASEARPLSLPLGSRRLLPDDRPAWVAAAPDLSQPTHRLFIGSEPVSDKQQLDAALDTALVHAVSRYIDKHILHSAAAAAKLPLTASFVRFNFLNDRQEYVAELSTSSGPLYQKWVIVEVTPEQRAVIRRMYQDIIQRERLGALALLAVGVCACVGMVHIVARSLGRRWEGVAAR
ncbi:MAG: hypothetical protein KatS3mg111_3682 [Pirellulaceae bacterium]|nr:MAG: hypothetical protein KatS3mg111_3682 [Pirellulaceae bacterium]